MKEDVIGLFAVFNGAGEYLAVCHSPKTGYKAPNAYGARPLLQSETTKDYCASQDSATKILASDITFCKVFLMDYCFFSLLRND